MRFCNIVIIPCVHEVAAYLTRQIKVLKMDLALCQELSKHIEELTTSGKSALDQEIMRKIKKTCRYIILHYIIHYKREQNLRLNAFTIFIVANNVLWWFFRLSDDYVKEVFRLSMTQLEKDHAEIRRSAFQIMNELFCRSHCFRELLLADFQYFMELTIG